MRQAERKRKECYLSKANTYSLMVRDLLFISFVSLFMLSQLKYSNFHGKRVFFFTHKFLIFYQLFSSIHLFVCLSHILAITTTNV